MRFTLLEPERSQSTLSYGVPSQSTPKFIRGRKVLSKKWPSNICIFLYGLDGWISVKIIFYKCHLLNNKIKVIIRQTRDIQIRTLTRTHKQPINIAIYYLMHFEFKFSDFERKWLHHASVSINDASGSESIVNGEGGRAHQHSNIQHISRTRRQNS